MAMVNASTQTQPWLPAAPFWDSLPESVAAGLREDYDEKAAHLQYGDLMPQGMAEAAAYAFMFSDCPDVISPFVSDDEIERQLLRAKIIRGTRARWWVAYLQSFVPWVRQREEDVRIVP